MPGLRKPIALAPAAQASVLRAVSAALRQAAADEAAADGLVEVRDPFGAPPVRVAPPRTLARLTAAQVLEAGAAQLVVASAPPAREAA